ncbi:hypothetical protein [Micrococcus terreus]|uniref:Uncharacterized protein n=1 Tax=Micrococcus terreus TaxID=574650 RepID=A0A1I7MHC5_9MICC|nr:hypothetical protein [Micrococcus terreus]SFV21317.1 hypothetical protein SAMN04487966_102293 [Micrococcus terreus]
MNPDIRNTIEHEQIIWQDGYRAGLDQGRTEMSCPHVHPRISASAERMFSGWEGAEAAHRRSVERFRQGVNA